MMYKTLLILIFWTGFCINAAFAVTEIEQVDSPNGVRAWLVSEPSIPSVSFNFTFIGGGLLDAPERAGASDLMVRLLNQGAGGLTAEEFSRRAEELAANFWFNTRKGAIVITAQVLKSNIDEALALLKTAIHTPDFNTDAMDRLKQQTLLGIERKAQNPNSIASQTALENMFGSHPYARATEGTAESVAALTREDIKAAHRATLARDRVYIGAVGDITGAELAVVLDNLIAPLPDTGAPLPDKATYAAKPGVEVVDFDTPQTILRWSLPAITRDDKDFFPAFVLNEVMGGAGFQARLYKEIRLKRGLTYAVNTHIITTPWADFWAGGMASGSDTVGEAVDIIRQLVADTAEIGITEDELANAKRFLMGSYPLRFDGNQKIVRILSGMQADDLPIDYIVTRNDMVAAVTLEQVNAVAKRLFNAEGLSFLLVGQPVLSDK